MDWREATISAGVGPGWEPLVDELHAKAIAIKPDLIVDQVKEKFGGLRYYASGMPVRIDIVGVGSFSREFGDLHELNELVKEYEARSFKTCEWCGSTGLDVIVGTGAEQRWLKTLCPTHRAAWDNGERWWT